METQKKILIVDDEPSIVFALESLLSANNYKIEKSYNGKDGLKMAKTFTPDLILLDVMMPFIDGFEFSSLIRKDKKLAHSKIILLTAKGNITDKNAGYNKGCDDYIVKPFSSEVLLSKIKYFLG
jgi:two-component system alkaline phosphatase synthesis response regulator PhoP